MNQDQDFSDELQAYVNALTLKTLEKLEQKYPNDHHDERLIALAAAYSLTMPEGSIEDFCTTFSKLASEQDELKYLFEYPADISLQEKLEASMATTDIIVKVVCALIAAVVEHKFEDQPEEKPTDQDILLNHELCNELRHHNDTLDHKKSQDASLSEDSQDEDVQIEFV